MKYYEWVEEQERFKQLEEKERMNIFMDSFSNGLDLKQKLFLILTIMLESGIMIT